MSRTHRNIGPKFRANYAHPGVVDGFTWPTCGCVFAFKGGDIVVGGKKWWADTHPLGKRRLKRQASHARRNAGKDFLRRELAEG